MPASGIVIRLPAVALLIGSSAASADKFDYALRTDLRHSDNIALSANNRDGANVLEPGVDFSYLRQGSTVQANVIGSVGYRDYLGSNFGSQVLGTLGGQANWTVSPQRLDLTVQDYAGVEPEDALRSDAPNNQQQTNVLSLGPTLYFLLGQTTRGQAEVRFIDSYASRSKEFDSTRGAATLRIIRDINPTDQVSLVADGQHVKFTDRTGGPDYQRYEAYGRYKSKLSQFDADVMLGWTQLRSSGWSTRSDPLALASVGWQATAQSSLRLTGAYQYSDAALDLLTTPAMTTMMATTPLSSGGVVVSSQVYQERRVALAYTLQLDRVSISLQPEFRKLDYLVTQTFDQRGRGVIFSGEYRISPTVTLSAFADGERLTYSALDRRDTTLNFGADLRHELNRQWSWHVSYLRQHRTSSLDEAQYRENEIAFGVVFRK